MKQVVLKHALTDKPAAADFALIDVDTPACPDKGVLVRVKHISLDPYVGTRLRGQHMGEPAPKPGTGLIPGAVVGEVIESRSEHFTVGDHIHSMEGGWVETAALSACDCQKIDPDAAPLDAYIGVLGMPGLTAWAGVTQLADIKAGETFMVDAASGPVGATAAQIARVRGAARTVGIAGGPEKCALATDMFSFDACLDYKQEGWEAGLADALPRGLDVHFENVGDAMLALAMSKLNLYGRVVLCGLAGHYHGGAPAMTSVGMIVGKRAQMMGLVVYDYYDRWDEFRAEVAPHVKSGTIRYVHDEVHGLEEAGGLMERLVRGQNVGKAVVTL
ncbi:MAG: NADP-dependent oxidoreductase [Pseudomonadota bacterium]